MRPATAAAALAALLVPAGLSARPRLQVIGFSEGGGYLAYTLSGVYEGSAFPYCEIHVLDTQADSLAESLRRVDQTLSMTPAGLTGEHLASEDSLLAAYGISPGDTGIPLEYPALDSPPEAQTRSFRFGGRVDGLPPGLYSVDLFESPADTSETYHGMHPSTCRLNLTSAAESQSTELMRWGEDAVMEVPVYDFGIERILLHPSGLLVVFLSCTVQGFEIPEPEIVPFVFDDFGALRGKT